jgi:hypothetical protein
MKMRGLNKVLAGTAAIGLAATLAACGSDSKSDPKPVGEFKTLSGNTTSVALDSGFVTALGQLKLTPGLVGGAKMEGTTVSFPITGGNAKIYKKGDVTPYVQGKIEHEGSGLSLKGGATTVELTNFVVDPGNNSKLTGDVSANGKPVDGAQGVKLFDLDGSTLQTPTLSGGVATLTGTKVYLSAEAAKLLNATFKTNALAGGKKVLVGVATIKATGK